MPRNKLVDKILTHEELKQRSQYERDIKQIDEKFREVYQKHSVLQKERDVLNKKINKLL